MDDVGDDRDDPDFPSRLDFNDRRQPLINHQEFIPATAHEAPDYLLTVDHCDHQLSFVPVDDAVGDNEITIEDTLAVEIIPLHPDEYRRLRVLEDAAVQAEPRIDVIVRR